MPAIGTSIAIRRTASSSCRLVSPPGSGVPVPGAMPGSTTSTSTERNTASQSSCASCMRLGQAGVQPAAHHLGHLEAAHPLLGHPAAASPVPASTPAGPLGRSGRHGPPRTRSAGASGVPCPMSDPNWVSPVSAWASKWITDTRPQPTARATPVMSGSAMVWSPPRITGTAPLRATRSTACSSRARDGSISPDGISTSPASTTAELDERVDAERQVGAAPSCGEVVGDPDRQRAEAAPGPVAGAAVERSADDHGAARTA